MTEGTGDEPGGETLQHARAFVSWCAAHGHRRQYHHRHRAPRIARTRRRPRSPAAEVERRVAQAAKRARPQPPRPRLPRRQGAAAGGHPARRPRGRARRGRPRVDRRLVLGRDRRRRASCPSASPTSTSATCPPRASRCASRSRSASARRPTLGEYKGLEVGKREPEVADEAIDEEIERLRERAAKLETVERQAAARRLRGDGLRRHARRRAVRRRRGPRPDGRARLRPARARLRGAARGRRPPARSATVTITFPDDYGAAELAGQEAEFAVTVKRGQGQGAARARRRARRRGRLRHARRAARGHPLADAPRRETRASRPSSARPRSTPPSPPRRSRCPTRWSRRAPRELWDAMLHSLSHQGITARPTCGSPARTEEETIEQAKPDAEQALRREAVLAAVVEAEGIEPTEDEVLEAVERGRRRRASRTSPKKLLERLRSNGRLDSLKDGPRPAQGDRPASPSPPSRFRSTEQPEA